MAKIKINIKNTQLAEALKLGKIKKPPAAEKKPPEEKKAEVTPPPVEEVKEAPPAPPVAPPAPAAAASTPPPAETKPSTPAPARPSYTPHTSYGQKREYVSPPPLRDGGSRPPYEGGSRPPYNAGPRPPYQGGSRPPYNSGPRPPYAGPRPPYQGGSRPPYNAGPRPPYAGPRPPYQGGSRPPYARPGVAMPPRPDEPSRKPKPAFEEKKPTGFRDFKDVKPKKVENKSGFDSRDRQGLRASDDAEWRKRRPSKQKGFAYEEPVIRPKSLKVRLPITVKDLAVEMKLKASQLISKLFMQGTVLTLNDYLEDETTVQLLGHEFECEITIDKTEEERIQITGKSIKEEVLESPADQLIIRPPVVAFMGHVDHGKTSLIDYIRKTNVAAGEAGAITQHIGAFKCHTAVGDISILDTPGHEAFSAMRSRGADITDIIVLVIAGDEGMKAQTEEALKQAKTAAVPIVVALNKCDKPNFNADNIYRQLSEHELLPESWGGTTITVNCSAITGQGVKELLEMLALQAEVLELKASTTSRARGTVIESQMHKGLGPVATVLVQNGTLRLGDPLVFDQHWARVKTMHDAAGHALKEAGPSTPVKITGLSGLPEAGSEFIAVKTENEAKELAHQRTEGEKRVKLSQAKPAGLEGLLQQKAESSEKKVLTLILRADVQGSLEALKTSLQKIVSNKVIVNIISSEVGEISESDVQLAAASKATIIGFHTKVEKHAVGLIKENKITVRTHDIIYHAVDDVKEIMRSLLDKIAQENDTGQALVKTTFKASQLGIIAGCQVTEGTIRRGNHVRLMRGGKMVWKGPIASLKRNKDDVKDVSKGLECGILLQNNNDVQADDIIQAYEVTYLEQDL